MRRCSARGLPAGGKGGADDGKEGVFRFVILTAVQKFGKGVFKVIGVHICHLKAIIGDKVGFVNIQYDSVVYSYWVMNMKPLKEKISITLDEPVIHELKQLAEGQDRSLSSYINLVLKAHLENLSQKKNP